jgi:hypothetical protein
MIAATQTRRQADERPLGLTNTQRVRRRWLWRLEQALKAHGWQSFVSSLTVELDGLAREDGLTGEDASRVALRTARLCLLLLAGVEQKAAAQQLGVSERTGKYDAARLRRAVSRGYLQTAAPLPLDAALSEKSE